MAQNAPFGGPEDLRRAQRGQNWSQNPQAAAPGLDSWLQQTLACYRASSWGPRAPRGPVWAQYVLFWPQKGLIWDQNSRYLQTYCMTYQNSQLPGVFGIKSGHYGPSVDLQDPQKGRFGPKRALLGPLGATKRPSTRLKCMVTISTAQSDQSATIGTKYGPKSGPHSFSPS